MAFLSFVVILAVVAAGVLYRKRVTTLKEEALLAELTYLRTAIVLYQQTNHSHPRTLQALQEHGALESLPKNERGDIVDPFGAPYIYNPKTGWVATSGKGYKEW